MEKEFIPYELALELKELGFDEPCFMFYEQGTSSKYLQKGIVDDYWGDYSEPRDWNSIPHKPYKPFCQCISAPLYQQAFRWFREEYGLFSNLDVIDNCATFYYEYQMVNHKDTEFYHDGHQARRLWDNLKFKTYEEAELECLKKLIEIVKK
jgi:hypothetical protein